MFSEHITPYIAALLTSVPDPKLKKEIPVQWQPLKLREVQT